MFDYLRLKAGVAILTLALASTAFVTPPPHAQQAPPRADKKLALPPASPPPERIVTQGLGTVVSEDIAPCANPRAGTNIRKNPVGEITAGNGIKLVLPGPTNFANGLKLPNLWNPCAGVTPAAMTDVDLGKVPVIDIDHDGEIVTGFIVADNYFELFINGRLVGVDATPFTPSNSHVVRFRVKKPYTIAVLAQDWEDKLGVGMEINSGNAWHAGDGGFVAKFSDGTVTDSSWKAQSFYIAPLQTPDDVVEYGDIHDTSHLGRVHPLTKVPACQDKCFAIHYPIPAGWMNRAFDDGKWPRAYEYLDQEVGINGVPGYWRFPEAFAGSRWIWTINLVLDNTVLLRKTVN